MFKGRIIISFLLMCIYSFGFAHSLIPHCQDSSTICTSNHSCTSLHQGDEQHFFEGHCHEGIYDLVVCLLGTYGHHVSECKIQFFAHTQKTDVKDKKLCKLPVKSVITLFKKELSFDKKKKNLGFRFNVTPFFSQPPIEHTPLRGPPTFSC
ncbi:MAG: hypothetical protein COA49_09105 [Bacteroidetes bacterium]|nr:MAG: hypothetical protein COA49_09105 [Bacteroidota bacterium]